MSTPSANVNGRVLGSGSKTRCSVTNIPQHAQSASHDAEDSSRSDTWLDSLPSHARGLWTFGTAYMQAGFRCLLLKTDGRGGKIPPHNCPLCDPKSSFFVSHDRESCECLLCHGFYAATSSPHKWSEMIGALPEGHLAIRTGTASRLVVIDVEVGDGLETLDRWEEIVGAGVPLPPTARAASVSGGVHLYYRLPSDWGESGFRIKSRRILRGIDVKCDDGYVGAPFGSADGSRRWVDTSVAAVVAPPELLAWLASGSDSGSAGKDTGRVNGGVRAERPAGYDYHRFLRDGCPDGYRDEFMNDLLFRARKRGCTMVELEELAREAWSRYPQPPEAVWYMPWEHVYGKVLRVFGEIKPDALTETQGRWVTGVAQPHRRLAPGETRTNGRVTIVGREPWKTNLGSGR